MARRTTPRILIITPEITYLPEGMGNLANTLSAKAGGLADVSSTLVTRLYELGADIHVALPHYRRLFATDVRQLMSHELRIYKNKLTESRIHLAQDRIFYYRDTVYDYGGDRDVKFALAFQREVINNIIPRVNPDLVHCNDWMTGLIPGFVRVLGIPSLFTLHNIHTQRVSLAAVEDAGVDAAEFWHNLYFQYPPGNYEETREGNTVDMLVSGIFAAHYINTVSPTFLDEIVDGIHDFVEPQIRAELTNKKLAGCSTGILNAPDPSYDPSTDIALAANYTHDDPLAAKRKNKMVLQEKMGLVVDPDAPLFFWPSRLDPMQKGCQLLAEILYGMVAEYWGERLQVAVVANGSFQNHLHEIVDFHRLYDRVAVCGFGEQLSRLGYAGADFVLMPSLFEPCGLPQMIGCRYGSLPIVNDTGGLHDTVEHIDLRNGTGNGFVFGVYDSAGLKWAVDRAMDFYSLDSETRSAHIRRVMKDARERFNHSVSAKQYIDIYERMLRRPLVQWDGE